MIKRRNLSSYYENPLDNHSKVAVFMFPRAADHARTAVFFSGFVRKKRYLAIGGQSYCTLRNFIFNYFVQFK